MINSVTRDALLGEAKRRGWKTEEIGPKAFILRITDDKGRSQLFHGSKPQLSSSVGARICADKQVSADYIESLGYRMPNTEAVESLPDAKEFLVQHKTIVLKPADAEKSKGVTTDIKNTSQLTEAFDIAKQYSPSGQVLAQKQLNGNLYRLLIINGRLVAAAHRTAATITGDGIHTVKELIEIENQDPRRGNNSNTPLGFISVDQAVAYIGTEGIQRVPEQAEQVRVSAIESVSAGGQSRDVTHEVHQEWESVTSKISSSLGLFVCGFDIITPAIGDTPGDFLPILEMNAMPGFKIHLYPTGGGQPVNLPAILLDELFPA